MQLVSTGLKLAKAELRRFAGDPEFLTKMQIAFGNHLSDARLLKFQQAWFDGDFSFMPSIEIISGEKISNANAAFSASANIIYVSQKFLSQAEQDAEFLAEVLIEEIGHFLDQFFNNSDSIVDEGAIFLALVRSQDLTTTQLQRFFG